LLDAIGVSLGASGLGEGVGAFVRLATASAGTPESTIFGFNARVTAPMAALANGAMAHALDFEDAYDGAPLHPNAALIPAALALAQARGNISGRELLAAIALGCDLTCRLALSLRTQAETFGWYPPPIFGAYGAVAAAGRLIGLSAVQMRDAFSLALCQATCSGEIKYSPDSVLRAVRDAFPAQAGVISALLAEQGVRGFAQPFEGQAGFFRLYANGDYDPAILCDGLGRRFCGAEVSFKPWPSCRGTHGFIEAALKLRAAHAISPEEIFAVELDGDAMQTMLHNPVESKRAPRTIIDAKFSSLFVTALALVRGRVTLDDFGQQTLADPTILALAQRITHRVEPTHRTSASGALSLRLRDGRVLQHRVDVPKGDPTRPLSWDDLVAKAKTCAAHAHAPVSEARVEELADVIRVIESADDAGQAIFAVLEPAH
jgi:2-methylcitrate dehydratase PrpD